MTRKLSAEDRHAVDMLLDQQLSPDAMGGGRAGFAPPTADTVRVRLRNVRDMLSVLTEMPAEEPPADLVARTLSRIDNEMGTPSQLPAQSTFYGLNQPLA